MTDAEKLWSDYLDQFRDDPKPDDEAPDIVIAVQTVFVAAVLWAQAQMGYFDIELEDAASVAAKLSRDPYELREIAASINAVASSQMHGMMATGTAKGVS